MFRTILLRKGPRHVLLLSLGLCECSTPQHLSRRIIGARWTSAWTLQARLCSMLLGQPLCVRTLDEVCAKKLLHEQLTILWWTRLLLCSQLLVLLFSSFFLGDLLVESFFTPYTSGQTADARPSLQSNFFLPLGRAQFGQACAQSRLQQWQGRTSSSAPSALRKNDGSTSTWSRTPPSSSFESCPTIASSRTACWPFFAVSGGPGSPFSHLSLSGERASSWGAAARDRRSWFACSFATSRPASALPRSRGPPSPTTSTRQFVGAGALLWLRRCCHSHASDPIQLQDSTGAFFPFCSPASHCRRAPIPASALPAAPSFCCPSRLGAASDAASLVFRPSLCFF